MNDIELIATCWTSAGDAAPQRGDEVSPVSILERVSGLAEAGWAGIGLVDADIQQIRKSMGLAELADMCDDLGLQHREVEILADWWTTGPRREAANQVKRSLFDAATSLGAKNIKVSACLDEEAPPTSDFVGALQGLADEAADLGLRLAIEPMPFSSNVRTVEDGVNLLTDVNRANVGLTLDTWHVFRAGTEYGRISSLVSPESIFIVEIDDCLAEPVGSLWEDTVNNRLLPGMGDANTAEFVRHLASIGFNGPWGVEIISDAHRTMPLAESLSRTAAASKQVISRGIEK